MADPTPVLTVDADPIEIEVGVIADPDIEISITPPIGIEIDIEGATGLPGPAGPPGPPGPPGTGADEVWIGTEPPTGSGYELWFDTDATGPIPVSLVTSYVHVQSTPASTWTITHPLDFRPNVTVIDSANEVVEGEITYLSADTILIEFSAGFSGTAYLS